jgi:Zn-finger nucleic acid-binding protein
MHCPACQTDLVIVEYRNVELDVCIEGCGLWFDNDELRQLFEVAEAPEMLHDLENRLVFLPAGKGGVQRRCPRCRGKMRHVSAPGDIEDVILDRCPRGHGLWFDKGELEEILTAALDHEDAALSTVKTFLADFVPGTNTALDPLDDPHSDAASD